MSDACSDRELAAMLADLESEPHYDVSPVRAARLEDLVQVTNR